MDAEAYTVVTTTVGAREAAERIATALLDARLAACVQISGPIESLYTWKGERESAQEWLCTIKTRAALFEAIEQTIVANHPYETPEILATPVENVSLAYAAWIDESTKLSS